MHFESYSFHSISFIRHQQELSLIETLSIELFFLLLCSFEIFHLCIDSLKLKMKSTCLLASFLVMVCLLPSTHQQNTSVVDIAIANGLTNLTEALNATGLDIILSMQIQNFTLFGPTNDAFDALPTGLFQSLLDNTTVLSQVLLYHVASGLYPTSNFSNDELVPTLASGNPSIRINIYHNGNMTTSNSTITANGAVIHPADIMASNGILQVINKILAPPTTSISSFVSSVPEFVILVAALHTANLTDLLSGPGNFTFFAPINKAFTSLPTGGIQYLFRNPSVLRSILLYHLLPSTVFSVGFPKPTGFETTVNGGNITFNFTSDGILIDNDAMVLAVDFLQTNGVVHIVDSRMCICLSLFLANFISNLFPGDLVIPQPPISAPEFCDYVNATTDSYYCSSYNLGGFYRCPSGALSSQASSHLCLMNLNYFFSVCFHGLSSRNHLYMSYICTLSHSYYQPLWNFGYPKYKFHKPTSFTNPRRILWKRKCIQYYTT